MKFREDYDRLQHKLFIVREARRRGLSLWSRNYWDHVERQLIKRFNVEQGVDYAKLVL